MFEFQDMLDVSLDRERIKSLKCQRQWHSMFLSVSKPISISGQTASFYCVPQFSVVSVIVPSSQQFPSTTRYVEIYYFVESNTGIPPKSRHRLTSQEQKTGDWTNRKVSCISEKGSVGVEWSNVLLEVIHFIDSEGSWKMLSRLFRKWVLTYDESDWNSIPFCR